MINLSDTTPAPTSGKTNVTWQKDSSGDVSAQFPTPVDAATQAANKVLAGPMTGSAATPAFRLLVTADIPNIPESQVTNLTTDLAALVPTSRTISTTAPLTGGGDLSANRTLAISNFTGDSGSGGAKGAVPAPASGDGAAGKFLKADGTWATTGSGSGLTRYTTSWSAQTSVTVTHSLGTKDVLVQVYDASDVLVIPESVTTTSTSVVTLTFGASFTGRVVVIG